MAFVATADVADVAEVDHHGAADAEEDRRVQETCERAERPADEVPASVDEVVALPDREIFDAVVWVMERCKLVVEGAAAAPVAALLAGLVKLPAGSRGAAVLSGGNVNLDPLRGLSWN